MRVRIITFVIALAASSPARCGEAYTFNLDSLTGQPGVETVQRRDGAKTTTTWTKSGVSITRTTEGAASEVIANDNTAKGAVLCAWMIFVSVRATLATCPNPQFDVLRADVDQGISDIDNFIVANSIEPIDLKQLRARERSQYATVRGHAKVESSHSQDLCTEGDSGAMVALMNNMTHEQRREAIVGLLETPRWPVANPCL